MDGCHVIAGLGNPGTEYAQTRHNVGFMVVDQFAAELKARWSHESRFKAEVAKGTRGGGKVMLCKPLTYMNLSGESVAPLAAFYKVPPAGVVVVVDDADLPFGTIRMRSEGSAGGHHGLESVERHLGGRDYVRQRIGIGRRDPGVRQITGHVLGRFAPEEQALLGQILQRACRQLDCLLSQGVEKAMNLHNGAVAAPLKKESQ